MAEARGFVTMKEMGEVAGGVIKTESRGAQ